MTGSSKRGATGPGAADAGEAGRPAGDAVASDRQPETRDGERRGEDSPTGAATDTTRVARATLRASALGLQAIHDELERVARGLPAAAELEPDEASADVATELRSVIECVLVDDLRPAIEDLRDAAGYGLVEASGG